jgi:hypothetical protein
MSNIHCACVLFVSLKRKLRKWSASSCLDHLWYEAYDTGSNQTNSSNHWIHISRTLSWRRTSISIRCCLRREQALFRASLTLAQKISQMHSMPQRLALLLEIASGLEPCKFGQRTYICRNVYDVEHYFHSSISVSLLKKNQAVNCIKQQPKSLILSILRYWKQSLKKILKPLNTYKSYIDDDAHLVLNILFSIALPIALTRILTKLRPSRCATPLRLSLLSHGRW